MFKLSGMLDSKMEQLPLLKFKDLLLKWYFFLCKLLIPMG